MIRIKSITTKLFNNFKICDVLLDPNLTKVKKTEKKTNQTEDEKLKIVPKVHDKRTTNNVEVLIQNCCLKISLISENEER